MQKTQNAKAVLKKINFGRLFFNLKMYYKTTVTNTMCYWHTKEKLIEKN